MTVVDLVDPKDYFHGQIEQATGKLQIRLSDDIEFYLVNLLCEFIKPADMTIDELNLMDTPLALILKKATESAPSTQLKIYKKLGDISLYVAGYFQDSFNRKAVNASYYVSMGSSAYQSASRLMGRRYGDLHFQEMYDGLSRDFNKLVQIITYVAGSIPNKLDESSILRILAQADLKDDELIMLDDLLAN